MVALDDIDREKDFEKYSHLLGEDQDHGLG